MKISHEETDRGIIVIHVSGRIMLGNESQMIETLVAELIAKNHRNFIFELSGVRAHR